MKKKPVQADFETMKRLFDEAWGRYRVKTFNLLVEWSKTREENGWSMDEFETAMDKYNEKKEAEEKVAKMAGVKPIEKLREKVA